MENFTQSYGGTPKVFYKGNRHERNKTAEVSLKLTQKTHRVIAIQQAIERVENEFMAISFKENRKDNQRNERRGKR